MTSGAGYLKINAALQLGAKQPEHQVDVGFGITERIVSLERAAHCLLCNVATWILPDEVLVPADHLFTVKVRAVSQTGDRLCIEPRVGKSHWRDPSTKKGEIKNRRAKFIYS